MTEWTKEVATPELRALRRRIKIGWFNERDEHVLQQKWRITTGSGGKVEYREEWRNLPVVTEDAE